MSIRWLNRSGASFTMSSVKPRLSLWKTPAVSPRDRVSYVFASVRGREFMSISSPRCSFRNRRVSWMAVRVLRPRKSNFTSPTRSIGFIEYWVVISPVVWR